MAARVRPSLVVLGVLLALLPRPARAGVTERVSVRPDGSEGPGDDAYPAITPDGRFVAFSGRSDLVPGGSSFLRGVFVHDRATGALSVESPLDRFAQFPFLSADGRYVAFEVARDSGNFSVYVRDRLTGALELVSHALGGGIEDDDSYPAGISADGRFVVFRSDSSDLIASDTNGVDDIFVADRTTGTISRASVAGDGTETNGGSFQAAISADGRFVAFQSFATNLIPGEPAGIGGIFVRDRLAGTTERVSVASDGTPANDLRSVSPAMSADGRFVAFESYATNLVATPLLGQPNVYLHDRSTGTTILVSAAPDGSAATSWSHLPSMSPDGRWVAFLSGAPNLVPDDTNGLPDHFVFDRVTGRLVLASVATDGTQATGFDPDVFTAGGGPSALADGPQLAFATPAGNLVPNDRNRAFDTFVRDLRCGNGTLDPGEECDDGNDRDGDCCSSTCRVEPDTDGDGICDPADDCPIFPDPEQSRAEVCRPAPYGNLSPQEIERFEEGRDEFADVETVADGLGPVFNGRSCAECHNTPTIGGSSTRFVVRFGRLGPNGFDPMPEYGGSLVQANGITTATCTVPGEVVPPEATISTRRDTPALFGAGLVDALRDADLLRLARRTGGRPNMVAGRVGRFGWKAQVATLEAFAADAYLNEMGITSPTQPDEVRPQGGPPACDDVPDPEDDGTGVRAFADFMTLLAPLPTPRRLPSDARHGRALFRHAGCRLCHVDKLRTGPSPVRALDRRRLRPFSDFLLHDMGPDLADGIVQEQAGASEFRTAPLWGVARSAPYLHDGRAATLEEAIAAHGGEASQARDAFLALGVADRALLLAYLALL